MSKKYCYSWIPDLPDHRDHLFAPEEMTALPASVDLRPKLPPVFDQEQEGSCTANALVAAFSFAHTAEGLGYIPFSRNFLYYCERSLEGTTKSDAGAMIRDGAKALNKTGVCLESTWPYTMADMLKKPPMAAYTEGLKHTASSYLSVAQSATDMKGCLAAGFPIVVGFTVYESFESDAVAKSGVVPLPGKKESVLGGHAVLCVGCDDAKGVWICRNSWGTDWGMDGCFTMPYSYLLNSRLASDFWTIRATQG